MTGMTKWIIVLLIGIYVLFRTLAALAMTVVRLTGEVAATMPAEQAAYFLAMPAIVIAFAWVSLFVSVAAMALLAFERSGATRALSIAVIIDIASWLWERSVTPYTDVFTPAEQSLDALMFLAMISIVVMMMIARHRGTLT